MTYVYPAKMWKENDKYKLSFFDFDIQVEGGTLEDLCNIARYVLWQRIEGMNEKNLPEASDVNQLGEKVGKNEFIIPIEINVMVFRKKHDNRSVRKTLTIPYWLNKKAEEAEINFSQVLKKALKAELGIEE